MINLDRYKELAQKELWTYIGKVTKVVGMAIESDLE